MQSQLDLFAHIHAATEMPIPEVQGRLITEALGPLIWTELDGAMGAALAASTAAVEKGYDLTGFLFGSMLSTFMWGKMSRHFEDQPNCHVIKHHRLVRFEESAYLRFRSLREDGFPWPPKSESGCRLTRQALDESERLDDLPVLTIGWRLASAGDSIASAEVICLQHEEQDWWRFHLERELQAANTPNATPKSEGAGRMRWRRKRDEQSATNEQDQTNEQG